MYMYINVYIYLCKYSYTYKYRCTCMFTGIYMHRCNCAKCRHGCAQKNMEGQTSLQINPQISFCVRIQHTPKRYRSITYIGG